MLDLDHALLQDLDRSGLDNPVDQVLAGPLFGMTCVVTITNSVMDNLA